MNEVDATTVGIRDWTASQCDKIAPLLSQPIPNDIRIAAFQEPLWKVVGTQESITMRREQTAIHEAGHVVVVYALGYSQNEVTMRWRTTA
jgi:hypothetical protein